MEHPPCWLERDRVLSLLRDGELEVSGQVWWSSNTTFLVQLTDGELTVPAVYKPQRGERPLWDFPPGTLCYREVAAFVVSQALGWQLVPPTVLRQGPSGVGAVQLYVPHDPEVHYLSMAAPPAAVRRLVAFDVVVNNADRKSGHVLLDETGRLWAIDHGVTFHPEPKLRTVIWDYAGQPLPPEVVDDLSGLADDLADPEGQLRRELTLLLTPAEVRALLDRTRALVAAGRFPQMDRHRRAVPWPPV